MTSELQRGRFHFVYIVKFIRNGLVLCLLPMITALLRFDLQSLYSALQKDALILIGMFLVSLLLWHRGGYELGSDCLALHFGFVSWRQQLIPFDQIAVMEQSRPLVLRMLGATRITLYAARTARFKSVRFYLPKKQAAYMAETIMPVESDAVFFNPSGAESLRFIMLSANVAASAALLFVSARQTGELLGQNVEQQLNHLAMDNLSRLEKMVELFLPTGLAWLFTLGFILWGLAIFWSLLSTGGFKVSRSGGVILARGGHVNHTERRVLASAISYCDVRQTPFARLLRRFPVFLCAGSFQGGDVPFLVYKKGEEQLLQALLPAFRLEDLDIGPVADRTWPLFLWKGGTAFAFCATLMSVSVWQLPQVTPFFLLPLLGSIGLLIFGLEARMCEGIATQPGGSLRICYTKGLTRHDLCVLTRDISYTTFQTPFSETIARCNLYLHLPCRRYIRIRGIKVWQARQLKLN